MGNTNPLAYHLPPVVVATVVVGAVVVATVVVGAVVVGAVVVGAVVVAIVVVATVAVDAVVVVATLRAKLTPNGMQKTAATRTVMTITAIIQTSMCLVLLFSIGVSSHTDILIVLFSFQFCFFNH
jgi:hypothetical protein